jgi:hypothetical protein
MAIYPITNYHVINYDVLRASTFKSRLYKNVALTQDQIRQNLHAQIGNYV